MSSWIDDVGELNAEAHRLLDGGPRYDPPADCPPAGTWVRLLYRPEEGRPKARSQWHLVLGWSERWASVEFRCRRGGFRLIDCVLHKYDDAYYRRLSLRVSTRRPARSVCRSCAHLVDLAAAVPAAVAA